MQSHNSEATTNTIEQRVRRIIASKLQVDIQEISGNISLSDIGFGSLSLSDLAETIDDEFEVSSPNRMMPGTLTISGLINLIKTTHEVRRTSAQHTTIAEGAD
jgi:acyl carrier protein